MGYAAPAFEIGEIMVLGQGDVKLRHDHADELIAGQPVIIHEETGDITIAGERIDGATLLRVTDRLRKSRLRNAIDPAADKQMGFTGLTMSPEAIAGWETEQRWTKLEETVLHHCENEDQHGAMRQALMEARSTIETLAMNGGTR
jgi:hypothetical protein